MGRLTEFIRILDYSRVKARSLHHSSVVQNGHNLGTVQTLQLSCSVIVERAASVKILALSVKCFATFCDGETASADDRKSFEKFHVFGHILISWVCF